MQQIKSIYAFAYTICAVALSVYAATVLFTQGDGLWIGVLLTVLPGVVAALWRYFLAVENRADERESVVTALALVGLAVVLVGDSERGWPLLLAFSGVVGLLLHTYWASAFDQARQPRLGAGELQAMQLYDAAGAPRQLRQWRGQPCLVIVLGGGCCSCSYSRLQLRELIAAMPAINGRGAAVIGIVAQSPRELTKMARDTGITLLQLRAEPSGLSTGLVLRGFGCRRLWPSLVVLDAAGEVRYRESADYYRLPPRLENALPYL